MSVRLLAVLAALLLALAACNGADDGTDPADDPTPPDTAEAVDLPDGIAATVNGSEIPVDEVERRLEIAKENPAVRADLEEDPETIEEVLTARVLSGIIMRQVVIDGAAALDIEASEGDVAEAKEQLEETVGGAEAFAEQMAATGVPEEHLDEELRSLALLHLIGEHLTDEATEDEELDEDMRAHEIQRRSRTWLAQQLADAEVVVDARYGRWDAARGQVIPSVVDEIGQQAP